MSDEAAPAVLADSYGQVLDRLAIGGVNGDVVLKLTYLGLALGEDVAYRNVSRPVAHASSRDNFVRIDMEEAVLADATLRIHRRLREADHENVGPVLQTYLLQTERDRMDLLTLNPKLRPVKGTYLELDSIAFRTKSDVDRNYLRLAERMPAVTNSPPSRPTMGASSSR